MGAPQRDRFRMRVELKISKRGIAAALLLLAGLGWSLYLSECSESAWYGRNANTRSLIFQKIVDWDKRDSGWTDQGRLFGSFGSRYIVQASTWKKPGDKPGHPHFKILDPFGIPLHEESIDDCGVAPWRMCWDKNDRLWLFCPDGPVCYWEISGNEWARNPYIQGLQPSPPEIEPLDVTID